MGDEETQSREKLQGCQWEDLCRFQHFGQDLIMPLNFYDNIFKRLDIGTQPEFQSHLENRLLENRTPSKY